MAGIDNPIRIRLVIAGQVQGVGFRPFIYRLASELQLAGWVINDASGVTLEIQGGGAAVGQFRKRLETQLPPLAKIEHCEQADIAPVAGEKSFEIRPSEGGELIDAQVTVDTAVCDDCLRELADPADRRRAYPFINCTNCGPRYSIIRRIPYDRPNTTMADFAMCSFCGRQYADPADRRFHAQPIACPVCGPAVWLADTKGRQIVRDDPIAEAAGMLAAGRIVAIKGLGGFHIACRADDEHAVNRLRERKHRDAKPFAVMAADIDRARELCDVSDAAAALLAGPLRPIVLLPRLAGAKIAPSVAEGLDTLAVMLPYTPLHHLLFARVRGPLVMTSGNYSDEPLVKDNDAAVANLARIADAMLMHNRDIAHRIDDSVVQLAGDELCVLRRARGYAPKPLRLAAFAGSEQPPILAVGAELKSTICLMHRGMALLSEHIGDLKDGRTYRHFIDVINSLEELFDVQPRLLAADLHPQYLSTEYALRRHRGELPGREPLPIVRVQHHHAHAAACLAEHGRDDAVIALVCDGTGFGDDGAVWGCEVLRADLRTYERLGHLRYMPLIGGDAASLETWRPAIALLHDAFRDHWQRHVKPCRIFADPDQLAAAISQLNARVNCPASSSLGRLFDAVAGLIGVAAANRFEAKAPMKLEAAADDKTSESYSFRLTGQDDSRPREPFLIDVRPMVEGLVCDLAEKADTAYLAAKFHNTVVRFLAAAARRASEQTGLKTVALTGGCFANRRLATLLKQRLQADGLEVLTHREIPCNDGGISLGQAVIAAARAVSAEKTGIFGSDMDMM